MNYTKMYQPNPLSERFLNWIHKKRSNSKYAWQDKPCISIEDARLCCRLSQCYQEVILAKRHVKRKQVLVMSRVHRADQAIREAISQIPALSEFSLSSGDPGFYLFDKCIVPSPWEAELSNPDYLPLESLSEIPEMFQVTGIYTFYNRFRKRLPEHFTYAQKNLRTVVEHHRLPGAFNWNLGMGAIGIQPENVRVDFLNDYVIHDIMVQVNDHDSNGKKSNNQ